MNSKFIGTSSTIYDGVDVNDATPWTQKTSEVTAEGCHVIKNGDFAPWDNPEGLISHQMLHEMIIAFQVALTPLFSLTGIIGNILCAIVFYKQGLRERITMCLFSLAVADLLTVVPLFLLAFEAAFKELGGQLNFFVTYIVGLTGFTWVSMFLSTVIASERCFCVVSPFKAKQSPSTRTMATVIITVSLVLLTGMLAIAGHKHTTACLFDSATNTTTTIVGVTEYYLNNQKILDIFDIFVYTTAFPIFFILVIIVTTIVTAVKLRSALTWRQQTTNIISILPRISTTSTTTTMTMISSSSLPSSPTTANTTATNTKGRVTFGAVLSKREVAITKMLIATSILFIICTLPAIMVQIAIFCVSELRYGGRYHNLITALWMFVSFFRVVNSSLNVFVYLKMGSKFRETFKAVVFCQRTLNVRAFSSESMS